jgi:glycosyltransferase involved in cell wall biosynthesis
MEQIKNDMDGGLFRPSGGIEMRRAKRYQPEMITVILATRDDEEDLAHALAALAPAAMDGIVRDAIVVDDGSRDGTIEVADEAGCRIVHGGGAEALMQAAESARGDWLLFLPPATVMEPGWQGEALGFVDRAVMAGKARRSAATFRLRRPEPGLRPRAAEATAAFRTRFLSAPHGAQGLLIHRDFYRALGGHRDLATMADVEIARRIGRRRLTLLRAHGTVRQGERRGALRNAACLAMLVLRLPPRLIGRLAG